MTKKVYSVGRAQRNSQAFHQHYKWCDDVHSGFILERCMSVFDAEVGAMVKRLELPAAGH
jgi:hypothetical protein